MSTRSILITGGSGFIGTNYIEELQTLPDLFIANVDVAQPKNPGHGTYWRKCDILDAAKLLEIFNSIRPTQVVHLAARTDMNGRTVEDYAINSMGTRNVAQAISQVPSVQRAIFTSTQYVFGPGRLPWHDEDFDPHTVYGQSKVMAEKTVREAGLTCCWTITRPTNIWGSWHPRYPNEFWRVLKQGRYFHPGWKPVIRSYGYVKTVVQQMEKILVSPPDRVHSKVLYLGDPSLNLLDWVNAFSVELTARPARVIPRWIMRPVAFLGDALRACGKDFPLFSSRYRSMTQDYDTPMAETFSVLGNPQIPLRQGVKETVNWLREQDEFWRE